MRIWELKISTPPSTSIIKLGLFNSETNKGEYWEAITFNQKMLKNRKRANKKSVIDMSATQIISPQFQSIRQWNYCRIGCKIKVFNYKMDTIGIKLIVGLYIYPTIKDNTMLFQKGINVDQ